MSNVKGKTDYFRKLISEMSCVLGYKRNFR